MLLVVSDSYPQEFNANEAACEIPVREKPFCEKPFCEKPFCEKPFLPCVKSSAIKHEFQK